MFREELTLVEKEILRDLLNKLDILFRIKYTQNRDEVIDREIALCKLNLDSFNTINIEDLENKYKPHN